MNHRGVEFCVEQAPVREDVWIWWYQVDGEVRTGKTLTKLRPLAIRRVQSAIDRELRKRGVPYASGIGGENLKAKTVRRIRVISVLFYNSLIISSNCFNGIDFTTPFPIFSNNT